MTCTECDLPAVTVFGGDPVCEHHYGFLSYGLGDPL